MKTIQQTYRAISGYVDVAPGITPIEISVLKTEPDDNGNSNIIFEPASLIPPHFNEVQLEGDSDLRRQYLPEGSDESKILFLDDPDYDTKKLRAILICTKSIPLDKDENFVRMWAALSLGTQHIIETGGVLEDPNGVDIPYPDGGLWGTMDDRLLRNQLLDHIANMDDSTRDALKAVLNDTQWAVDYLTWRDSLAAGERLQYQSV